MDGKDERITLDEPTMWITTHDRPRGLGLVRDSVKQIHKTLWLLRRNRNVLDIKIGCCQKTGLEQILLRLRTDNLHHQLVLPVR